MYLSTKVFNFALFLFCLVSGIQDYVFSNIVDRDVINKFNITTCFRTDDAPESNVLPEQIKSVDGNRFYGFLVKIGWTSASGEVSFHCGGTLISDRFVLSAAHCMDIERYMHRPHPDIVRIAERLFEGDAVGKDIHISNIYTHPLYGLHSMYDDIALIELNEAARYKPACIWTGLALPKTDIFALGHDLQKIGSQQVMGLTFMYNSDCDQLYSPSRKLPNGIVNSQVCAWKSNITEPQKCKGFIGGPLLTQAVDNSDEIFVIGLTNYGQRCASSDWANIYTKLSFYSDWIIETVNDN